jgi:TolB-like protein/DNA-binding winged helix-turn-helix (wHTH) protein/tetratricopeptide (TPR) repeat protein
MKQNAGEADNGDYNGDSARSLRPERILMESQAAAGTTVRFSSFELNLKTGELRQDGVTIRLQPQPTLILTILASQAGDLVTREEIQQRTWGAETFIDFDTGLNSAIHQIRHVLKDSSETPRFIETVPRRGYRFVAQLEDGTPTVGKPSTSVVTTSTRSNRSVFVAFALLFVTVLAVGIGRLNRGSASPSVGGPQIKSLAVLPFESPVNSDQEYFTDGMTDSLITELGQLSGLRVTSQTSSMHYKGTHQTLREIAHELNVDAVVEGSVERSGSHLRIRAQLIRASTDSHLWARTFDGDIRDTFTMQSQVAQAIASEIQVRITTQEQSRLVSARPVNPEALDAYLKGRYFWNKFTRDGVLKSAEYFRLSIRDDPNYAPAYAGLADVHIVSGNLFGRPAEEFPKAKEAALKALDLDESLVEAHVAMAAIHLFFDWDLPGVRKELVRAKELNPNFIRIYTLEGYCFEISGDMTESVAAMKQGLQVDPLSIISGVDLGFAYSFAHRPDDAIVQFRKTLEIEPNFSMALSGLGLAYEQKNDFANAHKEYRAALALNPEDSFLLAMLAGADAQTGNKAAARKTLRELEARSRHQFVEPTLMAMINTGLGDKDAAFASLEKAIDERSAKLIWLNADPVYDGLHSDPRFTELIRRIGLQH